MPREEKCSIAEQRLLRFGLGAVLLARLRWPTSPRTGEMEGGFPQEQRFAVFKVLSKSRGSQFSNLLLLQGLPGSLTPPPARVGGLEQDGGAGHDHQLHRGVCNCRGEQRWWAGLSVDVNFGKLGVKGKRLICTVIWCHWYMI